MNNQSHGAGRLINVRALLIASVIAISTKLEWINYQLRAVAWSYSSGTEVLHAQLAMVFLVLLVLVMVIDGLLIARRVNKGVDAKFPSNTESGWKLGFYAASRASQLRRMRAPRPQVERGAKVA